MKEYKVGASFIHVSVKLDVLMETEKQSIDYYTVLGVSKHFIQLDGDLFPKLSLSRTFDFCHASPEKVSIVENKSDFDIEYFGKFSINIYSQMTLKRIESKINREFQKWVDEKIGVYGAARKVNIVLDNQ